MLQVRAGHCPNCKETTPPGAEFCPICGEDLGWQTTDGKKVSTRSTPSGKGSGARNILWVVIIFVSAYLVAVLAIATRPPVKGNSAAKKPPSKSVQTKPTATSTPFPVDDSDSLLENALTDGEGAASNNADNAASDNAASNSVSSPASNSASTPGDAADLEAP